MISSKNELMQYVDLGRTVATLAMVITMCAAGAALLHYHFGILLGYGVGTGLVVGSFYGVWRESKIDALTPLVVMIIGLVGMLVAMNGVDAYLKLWEWQIISLVGMCSIFRAVFSKKPSKDKVLGIG